MLKLKYIIWVKAVVPVRFNAMEYLYFILVGWDDYWNVRNVLWEYKDPIKLWSKVLGLKVLEWGGFGVLVISHLPFSFGNYLHTIIVALLGVG
jgi:hypothetical protein